MILDLFSPKPDHPLADPKELQRTIAELPLDNTFRAVDEINGWLESLPLATDFRCDKLFAVVRALDEAAQPHLRRLTRDYLLSPRLSRTEEKRLWAVCAGFWSNLAKNYETCLDRYEGQETGGEKRAADNLKGELPLLLSRAIGALGVYCKWQLFRYGPIDGELWQRLGRLFLAAEGAGLGDKAVGLYPASHGLTSPGGEYVKVLMCYASSMDCLLPVEIELAKRLINHFYGGFNFSRQSGPDSVYWVDPAQGLAPMRLVMEPDPSPTLHFLAPGRAVERLNALTREVEQGRLPGELNLGGQYPLPLVLGVLRHLQQCWQPIPPQRHHPRHRVKSRMTVVHGLDGARQALQFPGLDPAAAESWIVEDVSRGGFGATVTGSHGDWLRVGALLAMRPDGGDNWVIGVVRRYVKERDDLIQVGIRTVGRQAQCLSLRPRMAASYALSGGVPGLRLEDGEPGVVRLVLPRATFDPREALELPGNGGGLLTPVELAEAGQDYEIAHYRQAQPLSAAG